MSDNMVDSAGDDRTANNAVRHQYRILNEDEKAQMLRIKDIGADFISELEKIGQSEELTLSKRRMQEAVFWAVSHITG